MKFEPKLPRSANLRNLDDLSVGDCFLLGGRLQVLVKDDPESVDLTSGVIWEHDGDVLVEPVDCVIRWTTKPLKKKKKKK